MPLMLDAVVDDNNAAAAGEERSRPCAKDGGGGWSPSLRGLAPGAMPSSGACSSKGDGNAWPDMGWIWKDQRRRGDEGGGCLDEKGGRGGGGPRVAVVRPSRSPLARCSLVQREREAGSARKTRRGEV